MQSENLACEWNDVALLTDQRAYTFVCKTMLQIPEDVDTIEAISLLAWCMDENVDDIKSLSGVVQLQIAYRTPPGRQDVLAAVIPLQGYLRQPLGKTGEAQLIYSHGQVADGHLLLEAVLRISRELQLARSQVIAGQFCMEELLELPDAWPDCDDLLLTVADTVVDSCVIAEQSLQVAGQYRLAVLYADEAQPGEKLFAYEQTRPMAQTIPVPAGLQELTGVEPYYQSLSAELLDDRHIQISGEGVLCTVAEETNEDAMTAQMQGSAQSSDDADNAEDAGKTNPASVGQPTAPCGEVCPVRQKQRPGQKPQPSVVNSRGSRRANLTKHMRDLHGFVQTPTFMRNFEIGAELEKNEE